MVQEWQRVSGFGVRHAPETVTILESWIQGMNNQVSVCSTYSTCHVPNMIQIRTGCMTNVHVNILILEILYLGLNWNLSTHFHHDLGIRVVVRLSSYSFPHVLWSVYSVCWGLLVGERACARPLPRAWLIIRAFKLPLSLWGIKCPHPCPRTLWEQMILINGARMEGMCLCSLSCPHTEKPNLTNPLMKI